VNSNSRMLIYLSIMSLILSCVLIGYGLLFFGWGPQENLTGVSILPTIIVVAGLIIAAMNSIASNILSNQIGRNLETWSPLLRLGIPGVSKIGSKMRG